MKLQELLQDGLYNYEDFELLNNVEILSYVLGSELWESKVSVCQSDQGQALRLPDKQLCPLL